MKKKLFLILFFTAIFGYSQNELLSSEASVSVFTCGRGNELYTTFGHTAIRIKDDINHLDVVYNYGAFDFSTPNFYLKFVKGDLQYFINVTSYTDFIAEYEYEHREVLEQTLNIPLSKKQELFNLLNKSLYSEERYYTYKFIDRNCTTMVVEKINTIIGKKLLKKVDDTSISYRALLYPYFENHFYYKLGINIIFGLKTDAKAEKLFLPIELMYSLDKATLGGKPLVSHKQILVPGKALPHEFSFINSIYFIIILLISIIATNNKPIYFGYLTFAGILGLFLSLVGLYSLHQEVLWNYNILIFNPLFIFLPYLKNQKRKRLIQFLSALLVIYVVIMIPKPDFFLLLPFIVTHFLILFKIYKKDII
ncbi:lipoprotein N-acyltransferase Lnb domain-containing protein [Flavobacterium aciduliphilum]|uniref:Uncharacterized protein DUF4105 n=1 Tax=Flavobacterium aciduliphilum TaxID=1101402 RepID=A0A328Y8H7_9FLAO|nr:DUF4105 domain-containing protein [Flavobacterium aciduliphilum]RAR70219.1 uncharacterized protein DUF4105 [Flavobacterium aciduliphilum]